MNLEELEGLLLDSVSSLDDPSLSLDDLAELVLAAGIDPSTLSSNDLDHLLRLVNGDGDTSLSSGHDHGGEAVKFGAGTCYRCGGRGYATWPSSGTEEACWYCNGSGVAH